MVASDNSGTKCPAESSTSSLAVTAGATPSIPALNGNTALCGGKTDLTILPAEAGTYTYQWYKDGVLLPDTNQVLTVEEQGSVYSATVTSTSGCVSPYVTKKLNGGRLDIATLKWEAIAAEAYFGDVKTFRVSPSFPVTSYKWTVDGGATNSGTNEVSTITFPPSGTDGTKVNVKVTATNSCGTSTELVQIINIINACPVPVVAAGSATDLATTVNKGVTAKVTVTNGNTITYQWYSNTVANAIGGNALSGGNAASYTYTPTAVGTTYLYCIVKNGCNTPAVQADKIPIFTVATVADPSTLTIGSGTFVGKTCFDINKSNDGASCGSNLSRAATATDFNTQFAQSYIFTASTTGVKKNLRFIVDDINGLIESTNANTVAIAGTVTDNLVVTLIVNYKKTLSDTGSSILGLTTAQALKVKIYAVFNDGSKDVSIPINVTIQDCACCGAYLSPTIWKILACQNVGADANADPFTPDIKINGAYYNWGSDAVAFTAPTVADNNGTKTGTWGLGLGSGSGNWSAITNPRICNVGFHIPTNQEWAALFANNVISKVGISTDWTAGVSNFKTGYKLGNNLYLPASGLVNAGLGITTSNRGAGGYYWSANDGGGSNAYYTNIVDKNTMLAARNNGLSVRCIAN